MPASPDTPLLRKARGAFFTPGTVAGFIAEWAVRTPFDAVLEPSCGEAAFLHAAHERLRSIGANGRHGAVPTLHGIEIHSTSAAAARDSLAAIGARVDVRVADFFTVEPQPRFDAVIGNPPYIRYQEFAGEARSRSRKAAMRGGVALSGLASSWAAFAVHSALFLRAGGRMGLVLPAELLTVNYAAGVRRFLMEHFATVRLVMFEERVFPEVQEEVVLLLADGFDPASRAGTDHCELFQVRNASALRERAVLRTWRPVKRDAKWTPSMMTADGLAAYGAVMSGTDFTVLQDWGDTTLGIVTGSNAFFALSPQRVAELHLRRTDLVSLSPPGSRHLRGLSLTSQACANLADAGKATWLFRPDAPSPAARAYIAAGEAMGIDGAYKCRVRNPWWRVPYVKPADLLLTYMNADSPSLCTNRARVHHLNSVHGVYLHAESRSLGRRLLSIASLNTVTLLGAEVVGRAYGGGMLKLEPREADVLPVPVPALVDKVGAALSVARPRVAAKLQAGAVAEAVRLVDEIVLVDGLGIERVQLNALREARAGLVARRRARSGRGAHG